TTPVPGNPWIICTLWLAEHAIARATSVAELQSALDLVRWVRSRARPSLVLPEQIHPFTGGPLSVSPFSWSHAQVVSVVRGYLESLRELRHNGHEKMRDRMRKTRRTRPLTNLHPSPRLSPEPAKHLHSFAFNRRKFLM